MFMRIVHTARRDESYLYQQPCSPRLSPFVSTPITEGEITLADDNGTERGRLVMAMDIPVYRGILSVTHTPQF